MTFNSGITRSTRPPTAWETSKSYLDLFSCEAIFRIVNKVATARNAIGMAM
jgi:hypothetical protein